MLSYILLATASAAEPHLSYPRLVSTNGYGVLVFTEDAAADRAHLDVFSDHLYQQPSPSAGETRDLLFDTYFGLRTTDGGGARWLNRATAGHAYGYLPASGVLQIDRSEGGLTITEYAFAPMDLPGPALVQLLRLRNDSGQTLAGAELFSLHNFHLGEDRAGANTGAERLWAPASGGVVEQGDSTGLVMTYLPLTAPDAVGCDGVYDAVIAGQDLPGACDAAGDDQVPGMQWGRGPLAPGEEVWIGVASMFTSGYDTTSAAAAVTAWQAGRGPAELLAAEQTWWADWLAGARRPEGASSDELAVYDQALVALKMGQVREPGAPYGQLLASLPAAAPVGDFQHTWNITWVRDGAYAIRALTAAGMHDEARDALAFQIQEGCCGDYADFLPVDDYALSVCRYYGDGTEWSDDDGTGPNVELDNFGLYLWAAGQYVAAADDDAFLAEHADRIFDGIADVLVASVDPDTGLIIPDSSIWERHWYGREKRFTYTSAWAVQGLRDAADLADRLGESGRAAGYRDAADGISAAMGALLFDEDDVLAGSLEELQGGSGYLDAAAVDAFNVGAVGQSRSARPSLEAWEAQLGTTAGPGLSRNDDGDLYDRQEWIMIDLRVAELWRRICEPEQAAVLEDWITEHAVLNSLIIPELLDPDTADYAGPAPMMGFGSGLYALHLLQRPTLDAECDDGGGGGQDSDPPGDSDEPGDSDPGVDRDSGGDDGLGFEGAVGGCGCAAATGGRGGAALLLLGALLLLARRRR